MTLFPYHVTRSNVTQLYITMQVIPQKSIKSINRAATVGCEQMHVTHFHWKINNPNFVQTSGPSGCVGPTVTGALPVDSPGQLSNNVK